ncbi:phosphopantetheine-binding protein [uncultured Selenomonas sp.]|uniref:acyl carrier protein n=1 Tax=uncultured Selenomonas sp. TaxID=159275 RepID=UPI0028D6F65C|nr:phosphopantetheine-binding protein [uncultured Selenomonas sp.]
MDTKEKVTAVLQKINSDIKNDDTDLLAAGLLDSFDIVNLVSQLEENFGAEIDPTDIVPENFRTISAIAALMEHGVFLEG